MTIRHKTPNAPISAAIWRDGKCVHVERMSRAFTFEKAAELISSELHVGDAVHLTTTDGRGFDRLWDGSALRIVGGFNRAFNAQMGATYKTPIRAGEWKSIGVIR